MTPSRLAELVPGVWLATSREYQTVTTVLLDGRTGAVVVDPAWHADELAAIPADLAALGLTCVAGVATHEHYDHILWHPDLGDGPRWSTPVTAATVNANRDDVLAPATQFLSPDLVDLAGRLRPLTTETLPWQGPTVVLANHNAHAPGHLALLHTEARVMLAGDMLSDAELPMPADSDLTMGTYRNGLESLRGLLGQARWLIPGHGTPTNRPWERYDADMRYLDLVATGAASCDDPRLANPGMAELHAANIRRARAETPDAGLR